VTVAEQVPRFPFHRVPVVEAALFKLFDELGVSALVSSAACGADLLALNVAAEKGIPTRIIIPCNAKMFRASSVLDCPIPEYWSKAFETAIAAARTNGDIIDLDCDHSGAPSYSTVNRAIIEAAGFLAKSTGARPVAIVVWEGAARGGFDATDEFRALAQAASFDIGIISTI
jgi:hypothetical protein